MATPDTSNLATAAAAATKRSHEASEELRMAALGEILGDLHTAQQSQRDLLELQRDLDQRLTASVKAMREELKRAGELVRIRDTIVGDVALRAAQQARREFIEAVKDFRIANEFPPDYKRSRLGPTIAVSIFAALLTLLGCLPFMFRH